MSWKCPVDGTENQDPKKPEPGEYLLMRLKTDIGKTLCRPFGDESGFWTDPQFTCEPSPKENPEAPWRIIPNTNATNETLLNGRTITAPQEVNAGDVLSVGRESKGVIKLPLLVNPKNPAVEGTECVGCGYVPFLVLKPISQEKARNIFSEKGMDTPIAEEAPAEILIEISDETPAEEAPAGETATEETPAEYTPPKKLKGICDIVFLIDATQSMQPALEGIKRNIGTFVDWICNEELELNPVRDWRAKVVGYRDVTDDTASPLEDNPFVHNDGDALKAQLQALQTQGEDKGPSSLLDAIYHVANMGQTDKGAQEIDPNKWRYRRSAVRVVIIFTDADYHPETSDGGTHDDIVNACHANRILLLIFAPEMDCYGDLELIDKSEYEPIEVKSGETGAEALARQNQLETLKEHMGRYLGPLETSAAYREPIL